MEMIDPADFAGHGFRPETQKPPGVYVAAAFPVGYPEKQPENPAEWVSILLQELSQAVNTIKPYEHDEDEPDRIEAPLEVAMLEQAIPALEHVLREYLTIPTLNKRISDLGWQIDSMPRVIYPGGY